MCVSGSDKLLFNSAFLFLLFQDYGMWERGDKTNQGIPELNASSVGMAKVRWLLLLFLFFTIN